MSRCSAARMMSVPAVTVTSRPSIVSETVFCSAPKRTPLVLDVRHVLVAPELDGRCDRSRRKVPERAERAPADIAGDVDHDVEVRLAARTLLEPVQRFLDPVGAFAAGRALAARLVRVEA